MMVDTFLVEIRHSPIHCTSLYGNILFSLRKRKKKQQQHIKRKSVVKAMGDALRISTEILKLFLFTVYSSWIINIFFIVRHWRMPLTSACKESCVR